jgi:hypothetical protein
LDDEKRLHLQQRNPLEIKGKTSIREGKTEIDR